MSPQQSAGIDVGVTYAGAEEPFKKTYDPTTTLETLKADVLEAFGLAETTDAQGNQTVYGLYKGGDRLDDLAQSINDAANNDAHLQLRLVREVIAG